MRIGHNEVVNEKSAAEATGIIIDMENRTIENNKITGVSEGISISQGLQD